MNETNRKNDEFEQLLKKACLPETSALLRERVTAAARRVWNQTSADIPWWVPVRRLAISAAAAVFVISLANYVGDQAAAEWRGRDLRMVSRELPEIDALPKTAYGSFVRRLVTANRKPSVTDASALHNHLERLRRILDETKRNGNSEPQPLNKGRTRLLPSRPADRPYS